MKDIQYYANLSNGLEYAITQGLPYKIIRIQSTYLEQHLWQKMLDDLDYQFLMDLALGYPVTILDCKSHSEKETRAVWQGLPFIKWLLYDLWYDIQTECVFKGHNATKYAISIYKDLNLKKLNYFKPLALATPTPSHLSSPQIKLVGQCIPTSHDGDRKYLFDLVNDKNTNKD